MHRSHVTQLFCSFHKEKQARLCNLFSYVNNNMAFVEKFNVYITVCRLFYLQQVFHLALSLIIQFNVDNQAL